MKFIKNKFNHILIGLILFNLIFLNNSFSLKEDANKNKQYGLDWTGYCSNGLKQSPINILTGKNTIESKNTINVSYKLFAGSVGKKFKYDGEKIFMDTNLGVLKYKSIENSVEEIYEAYRIEIHYPSEHYITKNGLTTRSEIEVQIYHKLSKTSNVSYTNKYMKIERGILSILFSVGDQGEGDNFFNNLGISKYNKDQTGKINFPKKNNEIDNKIDLPASYGKGFNYSGLQGLLNLINSDPEMFFYYGSETSPPCRENVLWMIFSKPRSLSKEQANFFKKLIAKKNEIGKLYGNNRRIKLYDVIKRGYILHNQQGLESDSGNYKFSPTI